MAKKGYTLLEYLVALENKVNEIASNSVSGGTGVNIDLTNITNQINNLKNQLESLETKHNSYENSINNNISSLENSKMNNLQKTEYYYIGNDSNTFSLINADSYSLIKVYDDFNNYLLKENENYKRENSKITFNYNSPIKIRVEYY